jgi:uncharacterized protein (DUF1684 family)
MKERGSFEGLRYYPLDPSYRFELELHEHDEKRVVRVQTTHGGERELLQWGEFRFEIGEQACRLQAFKTHPGQERLLVPFQDGTSGLETYGKGRFLDLELKIHRTSEGRWILDFNEAYNPWCEYSDDFVCPFAPSQNWLNPPVRAGERSFAP